MTTHFHSYHHLFLSFITTLTVFFLTSIFSSSAMAATTDVYQPSQTAPTVLAWYYGPRYGGWRGRGWYRNGWAGYRCERTCFRNRWGNVQCVRNCY